MAWRHDLACLSSASSRKKRGPNGPKLKIPHLARDGDRRKKRKRGGWTCCIHTAGDLGTKIVATAESNKIAKGTPKIWGGPNLTAQGNQEIPMIGRPLLLDAPASSLNRTGALLGEGVLMVDPEGVRVGDVLSDRVVAATRDQEIKGFSTWILNILPYVDDICVTSQIDI